MLHEYTHTTAKTIQTIITKTKHNYHKDKTQSSWTRQVAQTKKNTNITKEGIMRSGVPEK